MKGIVIYKGKYGATAQYAAWLGEARYLPVIDIEQEKTVDLTKYDYVIAGSPVYLGKLLARDWLRRNAGVLQPKKVFLFVVCGSANKEKHKHDKMMKENVPAGVAESDEIFFLPGRVVIRKLSWFDRLVLKIGAYLQKDPAKKAQMLHGFDRVKRENINDIIKNVLHFTTTEDVFI